MTSRFAVRHASGEPNYFISVIEDISGRKQTEEALVNREKYLDSIIDHNPYPIWISYDRGTMLRLNRTCCDLLNIREEEVVGKYNIFKYNIIEEQGKLPLVRSVFEEGKTVKYTLEYNSSKLKHLHLDQPKRVVLDVTMAPVKDEKGRTINAIIIGMARHADLMELRRLNQELQQALNKVKTLSGLLPICASCKKIRDDKGYWQKIELYIRDHSEAEFSHGICNECVKKLYPEFCDKIIETNNNDEDLKGK